MADCYPDPTDGACAETSLFTYYRSALTPVANPFEFDTSLGGPILVVSNAPETLGGIGYAVPSEPGWKNLYKAHIPLSGSTTRVRVYHWHVNAYTTGTTQIGIRLAVPGGASINGYRRRTYVGVYNDITSIGMCLAERQLYDLLAAVPLSGTIPSSGEHHLWNATAAHAQAHRFSLVGGVHEFDLSSFGVEEPYLNIRTIVSRNGQWGDAGEYGGQADDVADDETTHPRGWWPHSRIRLKQESTQEVFNCALLGNHPTSLQLGICETNGGEYVAAGFLHQSGTNPDGSPKDHHGRTNAGCYGADLRYRLVARAVANSGKLYVGLRARNVGEKNAGAGRIIAPTSLAQTCVPKFPCEEDGEAADFRNYFDLLQYKPTTRYYDVGADTEITLDFDFAVASAAAMPTNLVLAREKIWAEPVQGGS